ncbi:Uncharacterised protein [Mycolicibacterium tokaiense]|uniref:Uncharacterized protein n=1 Tax=Mycolicibacterium tokaiense TaxID=39695 RepID=A0A378TDK5_9MYCO|nr:Uncharacterised protein [Mycolicibacterium tokaiense]
MMLVVRCTMRRAMYSEICPPNNNSATFGNRVANAIPISMSLEARPWLVSLANEISAAADFQAASVSSTVS